MHCGTLIVGAYGYHALCEGIISVASFLFVAFFFYYSVACPPVTHFKSSI